MPYNTINNVTVNKLTLSQYQALRAADSINSNEVYSISDIDDYMPFAMRVGKVIPVGGCIFFNSPADYTGAPLNADLFRMVGSNDNVISLRIVQENGAYVLGAYRGNNRIQTLATGTTIAGLNYSVSYITLTSAGYGAYARVDYILPALLNRIDSVCRINQTF